jgi:hypothetical protein
MTRKIISQREARRLRQRLRKSQDKYFHLLNQWASDVRGGRHVCEFENLTDWGLGRLSLARDLGRLFIGRLDGSKLVIWAVEVPQERER